MIELTDAEVDEAVQAAYEAAFLQFPGHCSQIEGLQLYRLIYRAGLSAGIERAAQTAERSACEWNNGKQRQHIVAIHCAAAIRALLK